MFKILGRQFHDWDDFMATVNFFRFNPHSIPGVSKLICKMGRHDFEPIEVRSNKVISECFYCNRKKKTLL